jgi:hypothetical protein
MTGNGPRVKVVSDAQGSMDSLLLKCRRQMNRGNQSEYFWGSFQRTMFTRSALT